MVAGLEYRGWKSELEAQNTFKAIGREWPWIRATSWKQNSLFEASMIRLGTCKARVSPFTHRPPIATSPPSLSASHAVAHLYATLRCHVMRWPSQGSCRSAICTPGCGMQWSSQGSCDPTGCRSHPRNHRSQPRLRNALAIPGLLWVNRLQVAPQQSQVAPQAAECTGQPRLLVGQQVAGRTAHKRAACVHLQSLGRSVPHKGHGLHTPQLLAHAPHNMRGPHAPPALCTPLLVQPAAPLV